MFDATNPVFPDNAIVLIAARLETIDPEISDPTKPHLFVCKRPVRSADPVQTVGVFAHTWNPLPESAETRGGAGMLGIPAPSEPTLSRYTIGVQAFVKDMDEERGLATHSVLAKRIRTLLARDHPLQVGFGALSVELSGSTERARRWGVQSQRFISNEVDGSFLYLSTLEFWLETETV